MDTIKIETHNICRGCLSFDRDLMPLKENVDLFFIILGANYVPEDSKYFNLLLCWECRAILKRIVTYQIRFQKSQTVFLENWKEPLDILSLSCLKTYIKNECDLSIEYNEIENQKIESKFNETVQNEVEPMSIKEESCDSFCDNESPIKEEKVEIKNNLTNRSKKIISNYSKTYKTSIVNYEKDDLDKYIKNVQLSFKDVENLIKGKSKSKDVTYKAHTYFRKKISLMKQDMRRKNCGQGITCSLCKKVQSDTVSVKNHWDEHTFDVYKCIYCDIIIAHKHDVLCHLKGTHYRILFCQCGFASYSRKDHYLHYKKFHCKYICDHCQRTYTRKERIEKHMMSDHLPKKCDLCHRVYNKASRLKQHYYIYHTDLKKEENETTYCVECNMQFQNSFLYKRHLRTAVAHKPTNRIRTKAPCPVCGKIFSRKTYMTNHYNLIHVQRSKYYCELCDKYFANGYSIRTHKKFVHDKTEKPRDKICNICGRGFFTNRVLINHKRTHTGERPHQCSYCDAAFAQDTARKAHERTQHKNVKNELE
ncbi:unnamed protein product, partial [Brenthis ino]